MTLHDIDVSFDFTSDTPNFWKGFWDRKDGLGAGGADPDAKSQTMRDYHQFLWSKPLPNGEVMELEQSSKYYMRYKDLYFGSDSITATFRYYRNRELLDKVAQVVPDYKAFVENYLHELYQIGGEMLLPSFSWCLNQARGCSRRICDRWDLTLECIKRYYEGTQSPLTKCLEKPANRQFFSLFVDFRGFVDFFFLQDLVDEDYNVKFWYDTPLFQVDPMPDNVEDYLHFVQTQLTFVKDRNRRIQEYIQNTPLTKEEYIAKYQPKDCEQYQDE